MKIEKICKTCEFNFSGACAGYGDNRKADNNVENCEEWGANPEYYSDIIVNAPWYIKEKYEAGKINYDTFIKLIDDDASGAPVDINIYDVIEKIYGLSSIQLANILDVSVGVITYAKNRGTVSKRIHSFSKTLCIPERYFRECTSLDIDYINICKEKFESSIDHKRLDEKIHIKNTINNSSIKKTIKMISECLECSTTLAASLTDIQKLEWTAKTKLNSLNQSEKKLVLYIMNNKAKRGSRIVGFTYILDGNNVPKLNIMYNKN